MAEYPRHASGAPACGYESGTKRKVRVCEGTLFDLFDFLLVAAKRACFLVTSP
jgi:hypothetical protein